MGHQDTKLTSMRRRLKELNDNPYLSKPTLIDVAPGTNHEAEYWIYEVGLHHHRNMR